MSTQSGAQLLVKCLETLEVEYIFGIPGAKIDRVFDALLDSSIKLITCRHEQNAAFIASAYGRLTGKPGVVLVTSGPGVSNLATGLLTATTEGDPVVALGGSVPRAMRSKHTHQSVNNVKLMAGVTKYCVEVERPESIPEAIANAFKLAQAPLSGATFISLPQDVLNEQSDATPLPQTTSCSLGAASSATIIAAAKRIEQAKLPILLLGMEASQPDTTNAIRQLLHQTPFTVISTYQAAGVIPESLLHCFVGRVGLFKNQPGDIVLAQADVVITIGFNAVEYDPETWNTLRTKHIININNTPAEIHNTYNPQLELLGNISETLAQLSQHLHKPSYLNNQELIHRTALSLQNTIASGKTLQTTPIHPLRFIYELQRVISPDTTVCCDVGTVYMWMARYFLVYRPHQLLFSNGQQTLGVALPWAIASNYARPGLPVVSISGDGGFLFSAMELETAVREKLHFIHFIWRDGTYNMVLEQELMKYQRTSGVNFGRINIPDFARAFGALGLELTHPDAFPELFQQALAATTPVLIDVPIDYSDNLRLFNTVDPERGH